MALRVALFFAGHCLAPSALHRNGDVSPQIMIEQPQLRQRDWRRLA